MFLLHSLCSFRSFRVLSSLSSFGGLDPRGRGLCAFELIWVVELIENRVFARPTVVERINNYLLTPVSSGGRNNINRLENLLTLSANCHELFGHGIFVPEPLGDPLERLTDETHTLNEYDVRFSWVAQHRAPRIVLPSRYLVSRAIYTSVALI